MTQGTTDTNEQVEEPVPFVSHFHVDYDLEAPEAELVSVKSTRIIVEFELKKLIRGFRQEFKKLFNDRYKQKHYHWVDS
jgi:hypothetical protein